MAANRNDFKPWLKNIISYYRDLNALNDRIATARATIKPDKSNKEEIELEIDLLKARTPITVSHYFRTGHYHQGQHSNALGFFATSESDHVKRLMIALVERIATIDPDTLDTLSTLLNSNKRTDNFSTVIEAIHTAYTNLAQEKYEALNTVADFARDELVKDYDSKNQGGDELRQYVELLLIGKDVVAEVLLTEHAATWRQKQVNIGKLTHDAKKHAELIIPYKKELDKQFRDYKIDISRLAQATDVLNRRLMKRSKSEFYHDYFQPVYESQEAELTREVVVKKQADRSAKNRRHWVAYIVALLVGTGEATVAAVGMSLICSNPIVLLLVFCGAFYANYSLVQKDTYDSLKAWWKRKLFFNNKGESISWPATIAVAFFGIFLSIGTGLSYAYLSYGSFLSKALPLLTKVLGVFLVPAGTVSAIVPILAGCIATATAIGLGAIFFVAISQFIINKRWQGIAKFFREEIFLPAGLWGEMTGMEKGKHMFFAFLKLCRGTLAVFLTAVIVAAGFGLFRTAMASHLSSTSALLAAINKSIVGFSFGIQKIHDCLSQATPTNLVTGTFNLVVGALIAFPLAIVETVLRFVTLREECAPVFSAHYYGAACKWVDKQVGAERPSTFSEPKLEPKPAGSEREVPRAESPIIDPHSSSTLNEPLLAKAQTTSRQVLEILTTGVDWNTAGQVILYVDNPAGAASLRSTLGPATDFSVGASEAFISRSPNLLAVRQAQQESEVGLPTELQARRMSMNHSGG